MEDSRYSRSFHEINSMSFEYNNLLRLYCVESFAMYHWYADECKQSSSRPNRISPNWYNHGQYNEFVVPKRDRMTWFSWKGECLLSLNHVERKYLFSVVWMVQNVREFSMMEYLHVYLQLDDHSVIQHQCVFAWRQVIHQKIVLIWSLNSKLLLNTYQTRLKFSCFASYFDMEGKRIDHYSFRELLLLLSSYQY